MSGGGWRLPVSMALMAISGLGAALILTGETPDWVQAAAALVFLLCFGWGVVEQVRFVRNLLRNGQEE